MVKKLHPFPHSGRYSRILFSLLLLLFISPNGGFSQFSIVCPPDTTLPNDTGTCGAVFNYSVSATGTAPATDTFFLTGTEQTWVVPAGITSVTLEAWGGQGNSNALGNALGGLGGYVKGDLPVSFGDTLFIYVGGGGTTSTNGGYNGGGNSGNSACANARGGGGGGASDVRYGGNTLNDRVIVAGGGGGAAGNRVATCGRGTGGGGGGGYYGGGGGAAWPSTSTTLPTGGSQVAGGTGGISTFNLVNNDGTNGALGTGGIGGDETNSNQAGAATGNGGANAGGLTGSNGTYGAGFTGQTGAGGSSYTGALANSTNTAGVQIGNGKVVISYSAPPDTIYVITGLPSGSVFPSGSTFNTVVAVSGGVYDTCGFMVTVQDVEGPDFTCPANSFVYADANCSATLPDYTTGITYVDNCTANLSGVQSPVAGTAISGSGTLQSILISCTDSAGNTDTCSFSVTVMDTLGPQSSNCPADLDVTPTTLDCNPAVNFTAPTFADNCVGVSSVVSSHNPGDHFALGSTTVTYTASDSLGNSGTCSFTITVHAPQVNMITVTPNPVCQGDTVTLTADPGYTYLWFDNSTASSTSAISSAGPFWVQITDSGCTGIDTAVVTIALPPTPTITQTGNTLCAGTFSSYQWYMNGTLISGATSACYTATTDGNYSVVVTDGNGCTGSDTLNGFTGLNESLAGMGIEVYPNPVSGILFIRAAQPLTEETQITLLDLSGRVVKTLVVPQLSGTTPFSMSGLASGTYLLQVKAGEVSASQKIVNIE